MKKFIFLLLFAFINFAYANEELLPGDEAFRFKAQLVNDEIHLNWDIAKGYYLYKEKIKIASEQSEELGVIKMPEAQVIDDEFFGKIGTYRNATSAIIPILDGKSQSVILNVSYQGCADIGVCYPPISKNVALNIASLRPQNIMQEALSMLKDASKSAKSLVSDEEITGEPLPPEQAFKFSVDALDSTNLIAKWEIADGYYLYHDKFSIDMQGADFGDIQFPSGKMKDDPIFGKVETHRKLVELQIPILNVKADSVEFQAAWQGCWDQGVCYPPQKFSGKVKLPALSAVKQTTTASSTPNTSTELSETDQIAALLQQDNILWVLASFFGFGLLLSFTPCVFPMIPILSGIIVGQKEEVSTSRALIMSIVFVLAMSAAYSGAGVLAGYFGENLQVAFQTPWVLALFSAVFVALAFSMFGYFDIQLPMSLQNKISSLSNSQKGGNLIGVAIMGFLSALIVGPCVAPPLAGALIYIGQTGDAVLGGLSLFVMSLGMGAPLIAVGAGVSKLPRAGGWMDKVKYVFGILMLAVAIYLIDRVISDMVSLILWASLLTIAPIAMGALNSQDGSSTPWQRIFKAIGLIIMGYGFLIWLLVARGGGDMLAPLSGWNMGSSNSAAQVQETKIVFEKIKTSAELDTVLANAKKNNQIVMFDFYADWCVSCIEMEKFTFSDADVVKATSSFVNIKADVTKNDEFDKELMSRFGIIGPPALLFFKDGVEVKAKRVVGFMKSGKFITHISTI
ncbi:MAG: protein-disulfide reductase DsbD [Gammaproteobacteria bacterium]|jgi:thiol:disulfide interchange protein DsbD|nr:protein-disulfide reductase DsbD [Gammaproteobacteria bacterium]